MPTFQITAPDGKSYRVTGDNAEGALQALQAHVVGAQPDKYQQAAIDEQADLKSKGIDPGAGYTRRLAHGATLGADNTIVAGMMTPLEMIKRGTFNPVEGYNYAKAREDQIMGDARKNTGALGTAAEILGGATTAANLAQGGLTAANLLTPGAGLAARAGASAADAAGIGAFAGGMEGNGLKERGENALKGGAIGALVGGAAPPIISGIGALARPVVSNIKARVNPEGFAQSQIARAFHESGMTPQQASQAVTNAATEGQGAFTLADALGNPGQRMLSTVARAPGEGRTAVVNALEGRQAGQGRRISNALAEGFESPQTAAQTEAALARARNNVADAEYGAVRNDAMPVDITNVVRNIDRTVSPATAFGTNIQNDSAEAALAGFRRRLTDGRSNLTEFNSVQRVRGDLSDAVEAARRAGQENKARLLGGALRELDASLEAASPGFRQANANFAQASRNIDAVDQGRAAAMRGRTEDTIPAFQQLTPEGQAAFRSGYVDPLISQTQGAAFGANKARPLLNDAFADEAAVMAPGNPLMQRRITREQTMFETRNHALGGSRTADNLADEGALGANPTLVGQILMGDWHGAVRSAIHSGANHLTGNTPAVRQEVANILLQNGQNINPARLDQMITDTINRIRFVQAIARNAGRGASGGLAVAGPGQNRR